MKAAIVRGESRPSGARELETEERCFILELWNHDKDPEVSLARARVSPGVTTARHRLAVDERYIILTGTGRVEVEGLEPAEVAPGDVVLIPAGKTQRIENTGREDLVFYCLCTPRFEPEHYRDEESPA